MEKRYYMAYGSNLNVQQMQWRCKDATVAGVATLDGYALAFRGNGCLTIDPDKSSEVNVAVWDVSEADEKALDRYEGFPNYYYKKDFEIDMLDQNGQWHKVNAFAYIMRDGEPYALPWDVYYETCKAGSDHFKFSDRNLQSALAKAAMEVGHER